MDINIQYRLNFQKENILKHSVCMKFYNSDYFLIKKHF